MDEACYYLKPITRAGNGSKAVQGVHRIMKLARKRLRSWRSWPNPKWGKMCTCKQEIVAGDECSELRVPWRPESRGRWRKLQEPETTSGR